MRLAILALGALLTACATAPPADGPRRIVTTTGVLIGETAKGVSSFKGVPFAKPPVGALRWTPPQPTSWQGERNATRFALPCPQPVNANGAPNGAGVTGEWSEDCLYLNVWSPAHASKAPIMLFLYGGGGTMGGGHVPTYDGTAFARDGVVLVTINYRHGAFAGFAHPALEKANGSTDANYHLLDAMAALRWMKANASAFGGDAGNITLFGESAGATMVANLITSPQVNGLFQKAIIESTGSLPTAGTSLTRAHELGAAFATAHGLSGANATADQLRAISAEKIIADARTRGGLRTVIDNTIKTQSIIDSFASGSALDIPMIIGTNSDEGRLSGTQRVATYAMTGAPVWQYFFDHVPEVRRAENPNGAPHAAELPFVFDTLRTDRRTSGHVSKEDQLVATYVHDCWVAFAKLPRGSAQNSCADDFTWPARTATNGQVVALFKSRPSLGQAAALRSPPNGAPPGPTSRDEE